MADAIQQKLIDYFSQFKKTNLKKGETFIQAEEQPNGVYFLLDGAVKMSAISPSGEELSINTFKSGSFFPMNWVLNNELPKHYYESLTAVTLLKAPKDDFLNFIKSEPEVVFDLLKRLYRGLDGYFMRMESLMSGNAKNRLVIELLIHAKRFGQIKDNTAVVNLKLTEKELAAQSGIARETVSRELQKLREKGLISTENKTLTIHDLAKMQNELYLV